MKHKKGKKKERKILKKRVLNIDHYLCKTKELFLFLRNSKMNKSQF
jgi:hypothetical protein